MLKTYMRTDTFRSMNVLLRSGFLDYRSNLNRHRQPVLKHQNRNLATDLLTVHGFILKITTIFLVLGK